MLCTKETLFRGPMRTCQEEVKSRIQDHDRCSVSASGIDRITGPHVRTEYTVSRRMSQTHGSTLAWQKNELSISKPSRSECISERILPGRIAARARIRKRTRSLQVLFTKLVELVSHISRARVYSHYGNGWRCTTEVTNQIKIIETKIVLQSDHIQNRDHNHADIMCNWFLEPIVSSIQD